MGNAHRSEQDPAWEEGKERSRQLSGSCGSWSGNRTAAGDHKGV